MTQYTLYIGLNDKDTKTQIIGTLDAYHIVNRICGDATIKECKGIYTHEDGTVVIENSLEVMMLFKTENDIRRMVAELKKILNQESIAVVEADVKSRLM